MPSETLSLIGYGLSAGVVSALPAGPVTVLLISRTLRGGLRSGAAILAGLLAVELGYVVLFLLGFGTLLAAHPLVTRGVGLVGSLVLLAMAVRLLRRGVTHTSAPAPEAAGAAGESLWALTTEALLIAATNPAILFLFAGVVTAATALFPPAAVQAQLAVLLAAMETGAFVWLGALMWLTASVRHRLSARVWRKLDLASGAFLAVFGLALPLRLLLSR